MRKVIERNTEGAAAVGSAQFWLPQWRPAHWVLLATLLAAFLRFYRLFSLAPEAWFDEIWFTLRARELIAAPEFVVFFRTGWGGVSALMVYLTAIAQLLGFTGPAASRVPAAAMGVLAVPLAYACFRELLRRDARSGSAAANLPERRDVIAALAAFMLSYLLHWVIISRVGYQPGIAPAAALFCLWQLKRANRLAANGYHSHWSHLLCGVALGVAEYAGPHTRFIAPLLAFVLAQDLLNIALERRRAALAGLGLTVVAAAAVAAPLALFYVREPEWFFARAQITSASLWSQPATLLQHARLILISFNFVGSYDPLTNYPGLPMFDSVQSLGFWAGHGWLLWNVRRSPLARALLFWEALMCVPSLITSDPPNFQRMIGAAAPMAVIIAIGWLWAGKWLLNKLPAVSAGAARWAAVILMAMSPLYQIHTLLIRFPQLAVLPRDYLALPVSLARDLVARSQHERVFVSRHPEDDDVIAFEYLFHNTPVERTDFRQCLPLSDGRLTPTSYLVLNGRDSQTAPTLAEYYPAAQVTSGLALWQDVATLVVVPSGARGPTPPQAGYAAFEPGMVFTGFEWSGRTAKPDSSVFMTVYWRVEKDLAIDYTSFVHVGSPTLVAQRDGQPCLGLFPTSRWRAGDLIRDSFAITIPPETPAGDYPLYLGWYTYPDLERLPLVDPQPAAGDHRALIAIITVER